ncbi:MAG: DUF1919 domain-containing protein [Selenomonadaceae bacterium]|nr:DUF1919 domain-containing protein [Selenomonadaceae bacterium]
MIKVLVYIAGRDVHNLNPALQKLVELYPKVDVRIIGAMGVYPLKDSTGTDFPFFRLQDIGNLEFDFVLVTGGSDDINGLAPDVHFGDVLSQLRSANVPEHKILLDRVICVPLFTFEKYERLKKSKPTIFAMNCFGGVVYHRFGLPFYSPLINMFMLEADFMKFLRDPMKYINTELRFHKWYEDQRGIDGRYPLFILGDDVIVHMNHYGQLGADFAKMKWDERKSRINWFNVIPVIYTSKPEVAAEFDDLPFAKKVCFVPFKSEKPSAYYLDKILDGNKGLSDLANRFGLGHNSYNYDIWDMLLYGKKSYY